MLTSYYRNQLLIRLISCVRLGKLKKPKTGIKTNLLLAHSNVNFDTTALKNSVYWTRDFLEYADGRLSSWIKDLARNESVLKSDCIISDNLVGLLSLRPDTILSGSFLWFDIFEKAFPNVDPINDFVSYSKELLQKFQPSMLCVKDIAMPAVMKYTKAVGLPWFGQEKSP